MPRTLPLVPERLNQAETLRKRLQRTAQAGPASGGGTWAERSENGLSVGGLIAPNSTGAYTASNGDGFTCDNLLFPTSSTVFDNARILFTLVGPTGSIFENLYSVGSSL
jgi:hypothetical protein